MESHPSGNRRAWVIGGTSESAALVQSLTQHHLPCIVSVTTEAARSLYIDTPELQIYVGRLDAQSLPNFLQEHAIAAILDASHPFATEISQLAIQVATQRGIPYLRYERPSVASLHPNSHPAAVTLDDLLARDDLIGQRVFLTIGYRSLIRFQPWHDRAVLFARILPSIPALAAALAAGFTPDRLIALRPPISAELERALWQQWQISLVITKASGAPGGEDTKQGVAAELGIKLVTIARPVITYPQQTSDFATALEFCQTRLR